MNSLVKTTLAVTLAIFSSTAAMGQQNSNDISDNKKGRLEFKEITEKKWFQELTDRIKLHGYAQGGYNYSHQGGTNENAFNLKRVIFWVEAKITDRWSCLFMHNFTGFALEYYTTYRITRNKALNVRLGQFKNGLSIEGPLSCSYLEAIDLYSEGVNYLTGCSSDPLLGTQTGRDLGLSLFGETNNGKFRYELNVMNGQGVNKKDGNNFKDIIARLEYRPLEGLNIVTSGQIGRGHNILTDGKTSVYNPTILNGQDYKRNRLTAGADYRGKAIKLRSEYLAGWDGDAHSWGAYVTSAIPLGTPKLELIASYDFFNYNTDRNMAQHKAIGGLQYWFYKRCRMQVQYVYKNTFIKNNQFIHGANHGIQCQMQVRFN